MSTLNKATWQSKFADFINRVAPFNAQPLIQKSEHQTLVGTDLGDSVIFRAGSSASTTPGAAAFAADFSTGDQLNIDVSGLGGVACTCTISNLNTNETGVINITKNTNATIAFANAIVAPFDDTGSQVGKTTLRFFIKKISSSYVAQIGYDFDVDTGNIKDDAVTIAKISGVLTYGTFTPAIAFGGGTTGITYGTRTGTYIETALEDGKIKVDFNLSILLTDKGSSSGSMTVTGLPRTANADFMAVLYWSKAGTGSPSTGFTFSNTPFSVINSGATTISLYHDDKNEIESGNTILNTDVDTAGAASLQVLITGWYIHTP